MLFIPALIEETKMKIINLFSEFSKGEVMDIINDNDRVNAGVRFNDKYGAKPYMHITEKDGRLKIKCEMIGRPTKDNGFLAGTVFRGKIKEEGSGTRIKGIITTSAIYHAIMLILFVFLFVTMIIKSSYNLIPMLVLVIAFEIMFFKDEFKKQGYIERYLIRALKRLK